MKEWLEYEQIVSSWGLCPLLCGVLGRTQSALLILKCQPWLNLPIHPVGLFVCFFNSYFRYLWFKTYYSALSAVGQTCFRFQIHTCTQWDTLVPKSALRIQRLLSIHPYTQSEGVSGSYSCFTSVLTVPHLVLESGVRFSTVTSYRSSKCFRFWATSW